MAAEQTVERLRRMMHEDEVDGLAHSLLPRADVRAVLAVVEAAQELDRWASRMPDAGFTDQSPRWKWWHERPRMDDVFARLRTQASDEGKA